MTNVIDVDNLITVNKQLEQVTFKGAMNPNIMCTD